MTNYNDGLWHGWNVVECPVHPKSEGSFIFEDGEFYNCSSAGEFDWDDKEIKLIAFRIAKEYREPREFWINYGANDISAKPQHGYIHVREVLE